MDKKYFRKICIKQLKRASKNGKLKRNFKVMKSVESIIKKYNPKSILFYMPMDNEVDLTPLFGHLRRDKKIFVPFMEGKSFKLVQYRLPLRKKCFGILEPENSLYCLPKIDMAIVPVVGVDGTMRRIGFGKGMYDRFFATLRKRPMTLFVQLEKCYTPKNITDDFDIMADIYITPKEIMTRGKSNDKRIHYRRCGSDH